MEPRHENVRREPRAPGRCIATMLRRATLLLVVLMTAAACTPESSGGEDRTSPTRPTSSATGDLELRAALLAYADCLRDEGVDASDPSFDRSGQVDAWPSYAPSDAARVAEDACGEDLAEIAFRPRGEAAVFLERAHQFQDCMADEGITDVKVSIEGIEIGPRSTNREIRTAFQQCRQFVEPP